MLTKRIGDRIELVAAGDKFTKKRVKDGEQGTVTGLKLFNPGPDEWLRIDVKWDSGIEWPLGMSDAYRFHPENYR